LREASAGAARFSRAALRGPAAAAAPASLATRGFDAETCARVAIGCARDRWEAPVRALDAARVPAALAVQAGLLGESQRGHYDRLRGRVIFPIRDVRGDPVAFRSEEHTSELQS